MALCWFIKLPFEPKQKLFARLVWHLKKCLMYTFLRCIAIIEIRLLKKSRKIRNMTHKIANDMLATMYDFQYERGSSISTQILVFKHSCGIAVVLISQFPNSRGFFSHSRRPYSLIHVVSSGNTGHRKRMSCGCHFSPSPISEPYCKRAFIQQRWQGMMATTHSSTVRFWDNCRDDARIGNESPESGALLDILFRDLEFWHRIRKDT